MEGETKITRKKKHILTFEENKTALAVLVDGVYLGGQTPPEDVDEHGVPGHHRIVLHSPQPVVLQGGGEGGTEGDGTQDRSTWKTGLMCVRNMWSHVHLTE